jgi:hypothetical protein
MTIKVVKLTHIRSPSGGIGTQLIYETDGVPMLARFPDQMSEAVVLKKIEILKRRMKGEKI